MTMSRSECGKLGASITNAKHALKKANAIEFYYSQPIICKECGKSHSFEKRKNKFCSQNCAAIYTNKNRCKCDSIIHKEQKHDSIKETTQRQVKYNNCINCSMLTKNKKYCSQKCQKEYQVKKRVEDWKNDKQSEEKHSPPFFKKFLTDKYGYKCSVCGISEWNDKTIGLELEHKDGNSYNNIEENLCLICPNCHSQTDTYKSKNKGNGRHSRRKRYQLGLSY
jgi:hypothetical protein